MKVNGKVIKGIRKSFLFPLSSGQVAKHIGIGTNTYYSIENSKGRPLADDKVKKLCELLEMSDEQINKVIIR